MMSTIQALDYAISNQSLALERLCELLRFPTISSLFPENRSDFEACTAWLVNTLLEMGFTRAQAYPTGGPDVVYAEWLSTGNAPTLLLYGHYDVMPVEPVSEWKHAPFDPVIDEERIRARGASDDKGQFFAVLCAAEAWLKTTGLPINLKVLLEGEEEALSEHLGEFLQGHREMLRCDGILIADMGGLDPMVPLIEYGTRGNCAMDITVSGAAKDLHSGTYGGAVDNPFNVLVRLLAQIQDGKTRKIQVPHFYDQVKELTEREQALAAEVPITDEIGLFITGAPALGGEQEYPLKVRVSTRPTFDIHGIRGGYTGEGVKTVIPATATAKVSFRLVPDQEPDEIFHLATDYLTSLAPPTVRLKFVQTGRAAPATVSLDAPVVRAANEAFLRGFGVPPKYVRGGGSLPILNSLQSELHPDVLMTGFGLPDDGEHAPNESLALSQFSRAISMMVHYFQLMGENQ